MEKEKKQFVSIFRVVPNLITILSLCFGCFAIKLALSAHFEKSVTCIILAAILDTLDGRFARLLNAQSKIGANLDSLCDFFNFGFVPSFIIYVWNGYNIPFCFTAMMIFTSSGALRLARFNAMEDEIQADEVKSQFFVGIPIPAAGMICLSPLVLSFEGFILPEFFIAPFMIFVGCMMISSVPTLSLKKLKIQKKYVAFFTMLFLFSIAMFFVEGWRTFLFFEIIYLASIPLTVKKYFNLKKNYEKDGSSIV